MKRLHKKMNYIFFTTDNNLFYNNIIRYCNLLFKSYKEMNKNIIRNLNKAIVDKYHFREIGDVSY